MFGLKSLRCLARPHSLCPLSRCFSSLGTQRLEEGTLISFLTITTLTDPHNRLLYVLGWGGYLSSLLKDFVCISRPHSPPVTRLSRCHIATWSIPLLTLLLPATSFHHLEYGMPSTHTANSISAALFLHALASTCNFSPLVRLFVNVSLPIYAGSVVVGRIYCGMHSISDCVVGMLLGCFTFALNVYIGESLETLMANSSSICKLYPEIPVSLSDLTLHISTVPVAVVTLRE